MLDIDQVESTALTLESSLADVAGACGAPRRVGRVLHVINGEHYSGAERVQDLLAGRLPEFGFEAGLACVKPSRFPLVYKSRGALIFSTPMASKWDLRPVRQILQLVRGGRFDLIHAHTPRTALLGAMAAALARVPLVCHVHSPAARESTSALRNLAGAMVEQVGFRRASALIAVSQSLGRRLCRWRRFRDRVFVVPNGVPGREPRPARGAGETGWTLGTIALFRPRKGLEVLLQSLALLRWKGLPVALRAVGEFETPEYRRQILARADALGLAESIEWTGFARDVDRQLARMDVFVLPSLFGEGLPMVVLEAMAGGVPVVATRVEGTPEAIRDGQDGILVEPSDPRELAEGISQLILGELDWEMLRASALRRHEECFSDRAMTAGVAEVYRRVLRLRRAPTS